LRNPKPFMHGPLRFRKGLVFQTRPVIDAFATIADEGELRNASSSLQKASQFYVSHKDTHAAPQVVRAQLRAILHPLSQLDAKLSELPRITFSQLDDASGGVAGDAKKLSRLVSRLNAGLPAFVQEGGGAGKDPDDPPGNKFVQDLLQVFMTITARTSPPAVKFDAAAGSASRDDVSNSKFGRFVVAVEKVIIDEMARVPDARQNGYRIENKRASMRKALKRARYVGR